MKKKLTTIALLLLSVWAFAQTPGNESQTGLQLVKQHAASIGLTQADIQNSVVSNTYLIPATNIRMVYLQQTYQGIPVYNRMQVLAFKDGILASNAGERLPNPDVKSKQAGSVPKINAPNAVETVLTAIKVKDAANIRVPVAAAINGKMNFGTMNFSLENVTAELVWYPVETTGDLKLVWQVFMAPKSDEDYWLTRIDASTGAFIDKQSLTIKCNFDDGNHSAKQHQQHKSQNAGNHLSNINAIQITGTAPSVVSTASYRVIAQPAESPIHPGGSPALVTDPWTKSPGNATTLGWHYDGTTYYSTTRGNNVHAYEDRAGTNAIGITETSTTAQPSLTFNFVPNLTLEPTVRTTAPNQQFNTTNLFYWNNLMHDLSYLYGFTETARNFQANNQGRGGSGNDYVLAEAQDGGGTNNANFSTPSDGGKGRMQMYLWTSPTPDRDGDVDNGIIAHEYAHGISNRFTGNGYSCLSNAEQMGEGWSDYFGLMITQNWSTSAAGDGFSKPRGIGTYALNQSITGAGIRQYRYCTDMTVNPITYANLSTVAVPHGVGTIWCTALWDMTWEIIQQAGINPNIFNLSGGGGNAIALKLVSEGMRLQPCSPGFIDGRNAILKADTLFYGAQYSCAIIRAFARRGMGIGASQGSSNIRTDQTLSYVGCSSTTCNAVTGLTSSAITTSGATVSWTAATGAVSYTVEYKLNTATTYTVAASATTATSVNLTGLTASSLYDWRVRTNCSSSNSAYASAQFTTAAPAVCNAPTALTASTITTTGATVSWTAASGAVSYAVDYKLATATTWTSAATATTSNSLTLSGLSSASLYDWRVRTNCSSSNSAYASTQFTTLALAICNVPTALTAATITTTGATVSWTAASGAVSYAVDYKLATATTWTSAATATTSTSIALSGLSSASSYNWRVRTNCSSSNSAYAQAQFTTAAPAVCNAPTALTAATITTTGATVSWTAASGAVSYAVDYKLATATTWTSAATATTSTSIALSGLSSASSYNWRVRTNCSGNSSTYAQALFTTATPPSGCGTAFEPNENLAAAASIANGISNSAAITSSTDNDYFKIVTTATSNIVYSLVGPSGVDYDMAIFNSGGTSIGTGAGSTATETVTLNNQAAGTYYIRIFGYNGANSATCYTIKATAVAVSCASTYDVSTNGTAAGAATIPFNTDIKGLINLSGDNDYYKFVITTGGTATITLTTLPADYDLVLYSGNGTTQLATSQNGGTTNESISRTYTAGTYYVRVFGYNNANNATSCYTLKVQKGTASLVETTPEITKSEVLNIYPNPVTDYVNVSLPGKVDRQTILNIFDAQGVMVRTINMTSNLQRIYVGDLPKGIYLIKLNKGADNLSSKFVIQ